MSNTTMEKDTPLSDENARANYSKSVLIYDGGPRTIHTRANQYVYDMPGQSWMVCWVIAGLADPSPDTDANTFFAGFPAEIRYTIMDAYLGASSGTGKNILGVYMSLITKNIHWWEPYIYKLDSISDFHTLVANDIYISKEIDIATKSDSLWILYNRILLMHISDVRFSQKKYDILVALRDRILTHPRAIEITSRMITYWDQRVSNKIQN